MTRSRTGEASLLKKQLRWMVTLDRQVKWVVGGRGSHRMCAGNRAQEKEGKGAGRRSGKERATGPYKRACRNQCQVDRGCLFTIHGARGIHLVAVHVEMVGGPGADPDGHDLSCCCCPTSWELKLHRLVHHSICHPACRPPRPKMLHSGRRYSLQVHVSERCIRRSGVKLVSCCGVGWLALSRRNFPWGKTTKR